MSDTKKTVLVVDDDRDLVRSIKAFLEARGYAVATAFNGTEAVAALETTRPDLIVLDVMMDSDAEGITVANALKAQERTRRIPIVIVSGFMNHLEDKYQSFEHVQGNWPDAKFFEKPVDLKALSASIANLISERESLDRELAGSPS